MERLISGVHWASKFTFLSLRPSQSKSPMPCTVLWDRQTPVSGLYSFFSSSISLPDIKIKPLAVVVHTGRAGWKDRARRILSLRLAWAVLCPPLGLLCTIKSNTRAWFSFQSSDWKVMTISLHLQIDVITFFKYLLRQILLTRNLPRCPCERSHLNLEFTPCCCSPFLNSTNKKKHWSCILPPLPYF